MNRAQLTDELIKIKGELEGEKVLKEKYKYRFKTTTFWGSTLVASMLLIGFIGTYQIDNKLHSLTTTVQEQKIALNDNSKMLKIAQESYKDVMENSSLVYVSKVELLEDLQKNYPEVSMKTKLLILETIISESEKYGMNPLILYSMCYVESSFRHWLEHETATIQKNGKPHKVKAVGLTGVVWEWHSEDLISAGIAETRGDLFDPVVNLRAGALVYNKMYHMEMHKSARYKDESALLRYFGGDYISYLNRIDAKIATFVRPNLYRKD